MPRLPLIGLPIILTLLLGSISQAQDSVTPRHYRLGFTPFPHEISLDAVNFTYEHIAEDADIIAHHFDDGIPWPEALAGEAYAAEYMNEWQGRLDHTPAGHDIYLALTPINIDRNGLAPYRGASGDLPLPAPWDSYDFTHPDVKAAFYNHAVRAIDFFQPDYVAIGIEVNLLLTNNPSAWPGYLELHHETYTRLKERYPDLPFFASVFGVDLLDGYRDESDPAAQRAAFAELMPYSDFYALSLYPYMTRYMTTIIPDSMFSDLFALSDKPAVIAETGYPAETLSVFDGSLVMPSDAQKQADYITALLNAADHHDVRFVINFVLRDYDRLYEQIGGGDLAAVWRDTGLYSGDGQPRLALDVWHSALRRPYQSDSP